MRSCSKEIKGSKNKNSELITIAPQEYVSNSVTMKRTFDEITKEHKQVSRYVRSQKFYPVPELFNNYVTLGFWGMLGSRYGSADTRNNNGAPILEQEFSSGPFGYQHTFLTGATPNGLLIHEEPQTQIYYHFKADYFHMSLMYDPNRLLLGSTYKWQSRDLDNGEFRSVENTLVEIGLDLGNFSLIYIPVSKVYNGVNSYNEAQKKFIFKSSDMSLTRYGMSYQNLLYKIDFVYGSVSEEVGRIETYDYSYDSATNSYRSDFIVIPGQKYKMEFFRVNFDLNLWGKFSLGYSLIKKELIVDNFEASSLTNSILAEYKLSYKYTIKSLFSYERTSSNQVKSRQHLKLGMNFNIVF